MTRRLKILLILCLAVCLLLGAAQAVLAAGSPGIGWWVLSAGGGPAGAGGITLNATLGQPVVGASSAGTIVLQSGYWATPPQGGMKVYLPLLRK
jgi:hypothetical protein